MRVPNRELTHDAAWLLSALVVCVEQIVFNLSSARSEVACALDCQRCRSSVTAHIYSGRVVGPAPHLSLVQLSGRTEIRTIGNQKSRLRALSHAKLATLKTVEMI